MIKSYSADFLLPVSSDPIKDGVISIDESGKIVAINEYQAAVAAKLPIERLSGVIVPGFVNSHCHLELSHYLGKIDKGLGLIPFIGKVIAGRDQPAELVEEAMLRADQDMTANGIVAVGDISNTAASIPVKQKSSLFYHTFVELIGFEPANVKDIFRAGIDLKEQFNPMAASLVPHAPYSVCKDLFRYLNRFCNDYGNIISIHNQESEEENKFYRYKTGGFPDFYKALNLDIDFFKPQARNSLQSILPLLPDQQKIILVHNTYTSLKDLYFARRFGHDLSWCFCPNANLYIEGRLPKIDMFQFDDFNLVLGTDSLASNDGLCLLSELKTLSQHFPNIPFTKTLRWATLNGAKTLDIADRFGSLEPGKRPGLNLITGMSGLQLTPDSKVKKIC